MSLFRSVNCHQKQWHLTAIQMGQPIGQLKMRYQWTHKIGNLCMKSSMFCGMDNHFEPNTIRLGYLCGPENSGESPKLTAICRSVSWRSSTIFSIRRSCIHAAPIDSYSLPYELTWTKNSIPHHIFACQLWHTHTHIHTPLTPHTHKRTHSWLYPNTHRNPNNLQNQMIASMFMIPHDSCSCWSKVLAVPTLDLSWPVPWRPPRVGPNFRVRSTWAWPNVPWQNNHL